jgi:plasmid maintenance system antidote protein VapI
VARNRVARLLEEEAHAATTTTLRLVRVNGTGTDTPDDAERADAERSTR